MRILHTADWHLGKNLEGFSRMDEQEQFLKDFVKLVKDKNVDLVIIAGDIYDSSNPPARAENMFYNALKELSDGGKRMTIVISGNHDSPERLVAARPLAAEHGIVMIAEPKSVVDTGKYGQNTVINSGEGFLEAEINGQKTIIITVPYPSEKRLNEILYSTAADEEKNAESYNEKIRNLFDSLSSNYREDTINIAVSHLFAMGAEEAGSERSIQLGGSYIIDSSCFPKAAQYVALGHIHKPFIVPNTDKKVRYSGAPLHYSRKEIGYEKGCYSIDVNPKEEAQIESIKFKIYKPIEVWKCESIEAAIDKCREFSDKECWVYLEVATDRYITEEEIKKMRGFKKDILEIIPKLTTMENSEEEMISLKDKSFEEIFKEFYVKTRGTVPEDELVKLLLSIAEDGGETNEAG